MGGIRLSAHRSTVRTTVGIDADLLEAADRFVQTGRFRSRGALLEAALRREIWRLEEEEIDRQIGEMANDPAVIEEGRQITAEFERADWEAFKLGEGSAPNGR